MPPSPPPRLSRRSFLASTPLVAGAALWTGGTTLAGCTTDDTNTVALADLEGRDPMDMELLVLKNLRHPGEPEEPVTITIRGSRILAVDEQPDDSAQTLDLDGGFVIPGFLDCHVHMQFSTPEAILAGGVTTVRDLGGPPTAAQSLVGRTPLKVLLAGRILTPLGGYPTQSWGADGTAREVAGSEDGMVAVAEQVNAGARVIKVALEDGGGRALFDVDTLTAIVRRAADFDLRVTAHCGSSAALDLAIEAGVRELCHLPMHDVSTTEMVAAAEAAMVLVPTLEIRGDDPGALTALAAFRDAGGEVLYGSDLGNGGTSAGIEVTEIQMMLAAGMSPAEVLRSATSDPALYLQLDTGRLEKDLFADLVVLGGDPFEDPRHYDDVRMVIASGQVIG